jgi:hypothetical protein
MVRGHLLVAPGADPKWLALERGRQGATGFLKDPAAAVTFQEDLPPLDRNERNKKETQVVIQAFEPS